MSKSSLFSLNESAAQAFSEIGDYLQLKGENPFKIKAYVKASRVLRELEEDLDVISSRGELRSIPGVGKTIAEKLETFLHTGTIPQLEKLKEEIPAGLVEMASLPGLGAKKTILLHKELGISSLEDFQQALQEGQVEQVKGFSAKSQAKFLTLVDKALASEKTFLKNRLEEWAAQTVERLEGLANLKEARVVGAVRRLEPQASRLELLLITDDKQATRADLESRLAGTGGATSEHEGVLAMKHPAGCPVLLHFAPPERAGSAFLELTGPSHFVHLLLDKASLTNLPERSTEEEVFEALSLSPIAPEFRHLSDPWGVSEDVLTLEQVRGNLHAHTTYSDGRNTLEEMVNKAVESGHRFFGVSDHSRSLVVANGLTVERLESQIKEVRELNSKRKDVEVFAANECDILDDGCLDYPDEVLSQLDYVVAAVHSFFHLSKERQTERILKGIEHPRVRILAHPTGRLLTRRDGYEADWKAIFEACASKGVALEINASPWRLDISEELLALALECDCLISINTDAHSLGEFANTRHGVHMARRRGVCADRVVNTWGVDRLRAWFGEN